MKNKWLKITLMVLWMAASFASGRASRCLPACKTNVQTETPAPTSKGDIHFAPFDFVKW